MIRAAMPLLVSFALGGVLLGGCAERVAHGPVPSSLEEVESGAEDLFDAALAGSLRVAAEESARLERAWRVARSDLLRDGASPALLDSTDAALARLHAATTSTDTIAVARAANGVSRGMPALYARYRTAVPSAVLRLDYLGREILLDARADAAASAGAHADSLRAVWSRLEPLVRARSSGPDVAARFESDIAAAATAARAGSSPELAATATRVLDGVDDVESAFAK